jgi:hypothetical protein
MFERDLGENGELSFEEAHSASQNLASNTGEGSHNQENLEVIMGVDPSLQQHDGGSSAQEMTELGGMRFGMMGSAAGNAKRSTIDNMDLDEVVEDQHVAEPSGAVKRVGFAE